MNPFKLLKLLLWLVVILIVALFAVGYFADDLAQKGIEAGGSEALGVDTTVDSCDIGFFRGTFEMADLAVANPEGFGEGRFLELGRGFVEVSATSLLSDKIELPALELSKIRLSLVQRGGTSNYGKILDHLKSFQGGGADEAETEGEGKRFVVKKLLIEDVLVTVVPVQELGLGKVDVPIDRIVLKDVGSESDEGVLLSELAGIVVESILKRASATGRLPNLVQGALAGKLGGLRGLQKAGVKALDDILGGGNKLPGGLPTGIDDAKDKLKKGLKGFGIK